MMKDQVSRDLVQSDYDEVLAEYFTDKEQYLLFAQEQDFDLDTCLELCDQVKLLNDEMLDNKTEQKDEILQADLEFNAYIEDQENRASNESVAAEMETTSATTEREVFGWSWW